MRSVLCIAGHDPSGGAGISADVRACARLGVECRSVITTLTSQSHDDFLDIKPVAPRQIEKQLDAVLADGNIDAVKIGLVYSPRTSALLAKKLSGLEVPVVLDPVLASTSGGNMALRGLVGAMKQGLFPITEILTPNRMEAEMLTGLRVGNPESAQKACQILRGQKVRNVLLKGGHFVGERASDLLFNGKEFHEISSKRVDREFRGTGCIYSTLIAGHRAMGNDVLESVRSSKNILYKAMEYTASLDASDRTLVFGRGDGT